MDTNPNSSLASYYTTEHLEWLKKIDAKLGQLVGNLGTIALIVLVIFVLSAGSYWFGWHTPTIFKP